MGNQFIKLVKVALVILSATLFFQSCLEEKVDVKSPKTQGLTLQLHNFNGQQVTENSVLILGGSAPDIFYFKQNADGTYHFTLSSGYEQPLVYTNFDWDAKYKAGTLSKDGIVQELFDVDFPVPNNFDELGQVIYSYWEMNTQRFTTQQNELAYLYNGNVFTINPWLDQNASFPYIIYSWYSSLQRASDDGYAMSQTGGDNVVYSKYSSNGNLAFEHSQPFPYFDAFTGECFSVFAKNTGGDHYFIETTIPTANNLPSYRVFLTPSPGFINLVGYQEGPSSNFDVEIIFGPGKSQKAHRFLSSTGVGAISDWDDLKYQDYVDVPFEVWDVTNNRQLMVSFRDQGREGEFDLVPYDLFSSPTEQQSREYIFVNNFPYSATPNATVMAGGENLFFNNYFIWPFLNNGFVWDPTNLPLTTLLVDYTPPAVWQNRLVKVNESGITTVKENFMRGNFPLRNIFKILPYKDGFAVLCNAPQPLSGFSPAQLIIVDSEFNQIDVSDISNDADNIHRMESSGDAIFYSSGPQFFISVYKDGKTIKKDFSDLIGFESMYLESYNITPTITGGLAVLAWVKPTSTTRDMLFLELDENLELVKK